MFKYIYSEVSMTDFPATGKPSFFQREHPVFQEHEILYFFVTFDSKPVQLCWIRIQPGQKDSDLNGSGFGSTTRPVTRHNVNLKNIALHTGQQTVPRNFGHSVHLCCDVSIPEHNCQRFTSHWSLSECVYQITGRLLFKNRRFNTSAGG